MYYTRIKFKELPPLLCVNRLCVSCTHTGATVTSITTTTSAICLKHIIRDNLKPKIKILHILYIK